ncbi:MAG: hypothetical protein RR614_06030 [Eubacterium sp.]
MFDLFKYELKLKFKSKRTILLFIIGMVWSVMIVFFSLYTATSRQLVMDSKGETLYSGDKIAVDYLKKSQKELEGLITPEKLTGIYEHYQNTVNAFGGSVKAIPREVYAEQITPLNDLLFFISYAYTPFYEGEYDSGGMFPRDLKPEDVGQTYTMRRNTLQALWENSFNQNETILEKLKAKENELEEPFYFSSYAGWDSLESNWTFMLNPILVLFSCVILAPTYSKYYEDKSDKVFRAAKFGRKELAIARTASGLVVALSLYGLCMIINLIMALNFFNPGGLGTSVQFINIFSSANLTIGQLMGINIGGTIITILATGAVTLYLSAKTKSSLVALSFSALIIIINTIVNFSQTNNAENNSIYFVLNSLSPFGASSLSTSFVFNCYTLMGNSVLTLPLITLLMSCLIIVVLLELSVYSYCKFQY